MEEVILVKRITKDELHNGKTISSIPIYFDQVEDYEEYLGELRESFPKEGPMTIVLLNFGCVGEYKIILVEFEKFHKLVTDYRKFVKTKEGNLKFN